MESDILKIKSSFLRGLIAGFITKKLKKKYGDKIINISINDIDVSLCNDEKGILSIHVDASATAKREIISDLMSHC